MELKKNTYKVIGVMSGTSLDGVDIAYCTFNLIKSKWQYKINYAETVPYPLEWKKKLLQLENTDALSFQKIHVEYGFYLGQIIKKFMSKYELSPDFISSHGHTIFHSDFKTHLLKSTSNKAVTKKLTVQIGSGSAIAAECGKTVVCDFRSMDAALGGQGAPLVPIGDRLLFSDYDFCLNLGGFANISFEQNNKQIAFDICPVNIVMNAVCAKLGKEYDNNGNIASTGKINLRLLNELNNLSFYKLPANKPKSLGKEWVIENINPLLKKHNLPTNDVLRTLVEHISIQIKNTIEKRKRGNILVTGGGTYNSFLISEIQNKISNKLTIPDKKTIEFKEALIFAFLGVLRVRNEPNALRSVTGAKTDNIGGAVYLY